MRHRLQLKRCSRDVQWLSAIDINGRDLCPALFDEKAEHIHLSLVCSKVQSAVAKISVLDVDISSASMWTASK